MSDYRVSNGESFIKFGGVREVEGGGGVNNRNC